MVRQLFTFLLQYAVLIIGFSIWSGTPWYQNKEKEIAFLVCVFIVQAVISWFTWLFRPITIKITQDSKLGKGIEFTLVLVEKDQLSTVQLQRTVNLAIEITRRGSIWWRILLLLYRKKKIQLLVESVPKQLELQPQDVLLLSEVEVTETGFAISLNKMIEELWHQSGNFPVSISYPYFIADHPEYHIPNSLSAMVQPKLIVNNKPAIFLRALIRFDTDKHQIRFFRR